MNGLVALVWLALCLPPNPGGELEAAPGVDATPTSSPVSATADALASPSWQRPARSSQSRHSSRPVDHSIPATESEKEKKSGGEGNEGLSSLTVELPDLADAYLRSAQGRAMPTGPSGCLAVRLRC